MFPGALSVDSSRCDPHPRGAGAEWAEPLSQVLTMVQAQRTQQRGFRKKSARVALLH